VADPLEAPVLESFAGAIDSMEKVGAVSSGVALLASVRLPVAGSAPL
jgi:hypothetical protein